jgi:hypothetical protein
MGWLLAKLAGCPLLAEPGWLAGCWPSLAELAGWPFLLLLLRLLLLLAEGDGQAIASDIAFEYGTPSLIAKRPQTNSN